MKIVAPSMYELSTILGLFSTLTDYVKQVNYGIPTHGDFQSEVIEMPGILLAGFEEQV